MCISIFLICASVLLSAVAGLIAVATLVHNALDTWNGRVDKFIAVSEFVKEQLAAGGFAEEKIEVKPNFMIGNSVDNDDAPRSREYFMFVGRLTPEKGVRRLLSEYAHLLSETPLKIVGLGPDKLEVADARVEFCGRLNLDEVMRMARNAKAIIVPGLWPEPFGRVAIEAFAAGTAVIAQAAGGLTEIVTHMENGILVEDDKPGSLLNAISLLDKNAVLADEMGSAAKNTFLTRYSESENYKAIIDIYESAIMKVKSQF